MRSQFSVASESKQGQRLLFYFLVEVFQTFIEEKKQLYNVKPSQHVFFGEQIKRGNVSAYKIKCFSVPWKKLTRHILVREARYVSAMLPSLLDPRLRSSSPFHVLILVNCLLSLSFRAWLFELSSSENSDPACRNQIQTSLILAGSLQVGYGNYFEAAGFYKSRA